MDVKKQFYNYLFLSMGMVCLAGCSTFLEQMDEHRFNKAVKKSAQLAWRDSLPCYSNIQHNLVDFERGFIAGYVAVATGGDGCPPALPPQRYWKTRYSTPEGKKFIVAWFDGYHHGAAAALADGFSESRKILTSGEIYHKCREYVEYTEMDEQYESYQGSPEIIAPLPEPEKIPVKLPSLEKAPVPPAKPYVPELPKKLKL